MQTPNFRARVHSQDRFKNFLEMKRLFWIPIGTSYFWSIGPSLKSPPVRDIHKVKIFPCSWSLHTTIAFFPKCNFRFQDPLCPDVQSPWLFYLPISKMSKWHSTVISPLDHISFHMTTLPMTTELLRYFFFYCVLLYTNSPPRYLTTLRSSSESMILVGVPS